MTPKQLSEIKETSIAVLSKLRELNSIVEIHTQLCDGFEDELDALIEKNDDIVLVQISEALGAESERLAKLLF